MGKSLLDIENQKKKAFTKQALRRACTFRQERSSEVELADGCPHLPALSPSTTVWTCSALSGGPPRPGRQLDMHVPWNRFWWGVTVSPGAAAALVFGMWTRELLMSSGSQTWGYISLIWRALCKHRVLGPIPRLSESMGLVPGPDHVHF